MCLISTRAEVKYIYTCKPCMCPLRKKADLEGFRDPSGKLAAADRAISKSETVVAEAESTDPVGKTSKKRKKTASLS